MTAYSSSDVIFALATGRQKNAIGVYRLSGGNVIDIIKKVTKKSIQQSVLKYSHLFDLQGKLIDTSMVYIKTAPSTYTGEDYAEIHVHGSIAVYKKLERTLIELGARYAVAGEFSIRSFRNGKLSLWELESIPHLIDAENELQRVLALNSLEKVHKEQEDTFNQEVRDTLKRMRSLVVASIDFSEEDDVSDNCLEEARLLARDLKNEIEKQLDIAKRKDDIRQGLKIVVAGAPNVGKSSLINRLAEDDVSIVSDEAGTTRDVVKANLSIGGLGVSLVDTAGIRKTDSIVEQKGIDKAKQQIIEANLVIRVMDISCIEEVDSFPKSMGNVIVVYNKVDLIHKSRLSKLKASGSIDGVYLSARTGVGFDLLQKSIDDWLQEQKAIVEESELIRLRYKSDYEKLIGILDDILSIRLEAEVFDERIRESTLIINQMRMQNNFEEVLGEVFSRFCVGK